MRGSRTRRVSGVCAAGCVGRFATRAVRRVSGRQFRAGVSGTVPTGDAEESSEWFTDVCFNRSILVGFLFIFAFGCRHVKLKREHSDFHTRTTSFGQQPESVGFDGPSPCRPGPKQPVQAAALRRCQTGSHQRCERGQSHLGSHG